MEIEWDFNENVNSDWEENHNVNSDGIGNINNNVTPQNDSDEFGLSIIPVSSAKIPFDKWGKYQSKIAPISLWHSHFINQGTVGIITGKVSGNLQCIDVDVKNDPKRTIMKEFSAIIPDELLKRLIIQTTPNNGFHLIYRCPEAIIDGNQKLALDISGEVIIETRGEGGYFCTSKGNNKILQGIFNLQTLDINIPIITSEERNLLLELARSLTRYFPRVTDDKSKNGKQFTYTEPAINDFNNKYSIIDLFIKHNWTVVKEDDEKVYLLRDGSSAPYSGYYFKESKTFFCFSTSTGFKPEKPYNHFQVLQVLEGKNDYKSTLRLLPSFGFDVQSKPDKVTSDDIAKYLNGIGIHYDSFVQDLTFGGYIIDERLYNTIFINLKKHFDKEVSRQRFEEVIKSNYIQTINPILEFIEANKHRHPVGTFEKWLDCMVLRNKSIDKATVLKYLKKWYVGMIAQALDGEYPNEFFLTLISVQQGIGKTTLLRNYVLPKELHSYRKEHSLSFDDDFKVLMSQAMLIVDDEMDGRTYEADKTFKTVLSTKEITTRRKYDRRISTIKRRCSFAGSGNNLAVVREQQNRRIIPVEIEKIYFERLSAIDYTDLFIEAYHLYANGFQYSFQHTDRTSLIKLYDDYVQKSDVDLIMEEYIQLPETVGDAFYLTNLDGVTGLIRKFPEYVKRINVPTFGKIMAERGFELVRKGKNRASCYCISRNSRIVSLIGDDTQSWRLNYSEIVG
ncbi:MAG: bifunctional DNA primase/polymerase [Bacteroidales bacterium]|nr:bifunctional DNA primase/polymerase [Bacteroidales bacterium]